MTNEAAAQPVGVCYGWLGNNLPSAWDVVGMYKANNIRRMRIYYPGREILQALRGSDIDLLLDFPGPLRDLAQSPAAASDWVRDNVLAHWPAVRFRYVAVGNEVIFDEGVARYILPAMRNIYQALAAAGLRDQIKVSTSVQYSVMGESYPPSAGEFSSRVWPALGPIVEFLRATGAPLLVNVYPYFSYAGEPRNIDLDYAQFTAPEAVLVDGYSGLEYQNLFDAMVDAVYAALQRVGVARQIYICSFPWILFVEQKKSSLEKALVYHHPLWLPEMASQGPKSAACGLLFLNLLLYSVFTMIAGWAVNYGIEETKKQGFTVPARMFPIVFPIGNMATGFFVIFSVIAGAVGIAASLLGIHSVTQWDVPHLSSAAATSLVTWSLTLLSMGVACKEISMGWRQPRLRALETLAIILAGTQLLCTGAVHASLSAATSMRSSYAASV